MVYSAISKVGLNLLNNSESISSIIICCLNCYRVINVIVILDNLLRLKDPRNKVFLEIKVFIFVALELMQLWR